MAPKKGKDRKTFNDGVLVDLMGKDMYLAPVHFDADGIRTIGRRMAKAWLGLHGKGTPRVKVSQDRQRSHAFYFSAQGNNEADGSSLDRARRSLNKLSKVDLIAGDEISKKGTRVNSNLPNQQKGDASQFKTAHAASAPL